MSSLDGIEIDPLLDDLFAGEPRLMPHLHLSLQHGDDLILKRMKRRHLRHDAMSLVQRLKARRPDIAIGADLIAGFPTESDAASCGQPLDHRRARYRARPYLPLLAPPRHARRAHAAGGSRHRQGSRRRTARRCRTARDAWLAAQVGEETQVLAEADGTGYTPDFARVAVPDGTPRGTIATVRPTCRRRRHAAMSETSWSRTHVRRLSQDLRPA